MLVNINRSHRLFGSVCLFFQEKGRRLVISHTCEWGKIEQNDESDRLDFIRGGVNCWVVYTHTLKWLLSMGQYSYG